MFLSLFILFFHDGCGDFCWFSGSPGSAWLQSAPQQPPAAVPLSHPNTVPTSHPVRIRAMRNMPRHAGSPWGAAREGKPNRRGCQPSPLDRTQVGLSQGWEWSGDGVAVPGGAASCPVPGKDPAAGVRGCMVGPALPHGSIEGAPQSGSTSWGTLKHCGGHHTALGATGRESQSHHRGRPQIRRDTTALLRESPKH